MKRVLSVLLSFLVCMQIFTGLAEKNSDEPSALRWVEPGEGEEYGYAQLALLPMGTELQAFYRKVQVRMEDFGTSDEDLPESLVIVHYEQKDSGLSSEQMAACVKSLNLDHPEYFWIGQITQFNMNTLEVYAEPECRLAADRKAIADTTFSGAESLLARIANALPPDPTILDIADTTYEQLIISMEYDLETPMGHNITGAFRDHAGMCDAYAEAYKYLLEKQGVPCIVVTGYAGEHHAWNCVRDQDGRWFLADPTWDDGHFDEANRTYFNIPDRIFNMFHTADTPDGNEYLYPLPLAEIILPVYIQPDGLYVDDAVSLAGKQSIGDVFETLAPVCRSAVLNGKGGFGIKATREESDLLFGSLLQYTEDADGHKDFYFDLYMRDAAVDLADIYAGLTGEYEYQNGIASVRFSLYEEGTMPERVMAWADNTCLGGFPTLAAAYKAVEGKKVQTLSLYVSMAENYYLPVITPLPEVETVEILGEYGDTHLFTLRGGDYPINLTLKDIWLYNLEPMSLDLTGYTLRMADTVWFCQRNYDDTGADTGMARQCSVKASRIEGEGKYYKRFNCNVEADDLVLTDAYTLYIRGPDLSASFGTCTVINSGKGPDEYNHTYIRSGDSPCDYVTLRIGKLFVQKNQSVILAGNSSDAGKNRIILGDVYNDGGFSLSFYSVKLLGDISFELPEFEITGSCESPVQVEVQFNTEQPKDAVSRLFSQGDTLIHAPQMENVDGYFSVCIQCDFSLEKPDRYTHVSWSYKIEKGEDGNLVVGEELGHDVIQVP